MVLIHGASGNCRDFTFSLTRKLATSFQTIAFDRPGHGHSGRPIGAEDPAVQARLLCSAARKLGVERAIILGHSYGAAVALAWALEAPDMTAGVAVISGASHPWDGGLSPTYRLSTIPPFAYLLRRLAGKNQTKIIQSIFAPGCAPKGYVDYIGVDLALRPTTFKANAKDVLALHGYLEKQAPRYKEIHAPVEIIHGDQDTIVPADIHAARLVGDAPNANYHLINGAGHMPHHSHEADVMAAIHRLSAKI